MKRRKKNNGYIIFGLIAVFLSLIVGYALYGEAINVSGTAVTTGTFDIEFYSTSIVSSNLCGTPISTISGDKNTLTIDISSMQAPGATTTVGVIVKNMGTMPAKLMNVDVTGNNNPDIAVTYPTWNTGLAIAAGGTYSFYIVVTWNLASTTSATVNFTATLNYQQAV